MKKTLLALTATASLLAAAPRAEAADYGLAPASYDWSGGYVGVNAGMGFNMSEMKQDFRYTGTAAATSATPDVLAQLGSSSNLDDSQIGGGFLAGYNWQMADFVVGVEGDFNYLGFNGKVKRNVDTALNDAFTAAASGNTQNFDYEASWFGTVRGRLGYAIDNVLLFGTGGLAYGEFNVNQKLAANSAAESIGYSYQDDVWKFGWTLGGGIEYGVDRWTMGLQYLYVDLGSVDFNSSLTAKMGTAADTTEWKNVVQSGSVDYRFGVAQATLKYRF